MDGSPDPNEGPLEVYDVGLRWGGRKNFLDKGAPELGADDVVDAA